MGVGGGTSSVFTWSYNGVMHFHFQDTQVSNSCMKALVRLTKLQRSRKVCVGGVGREWGTGKGEGNKYSA